MEPAHDDARDALRDRALHDDPSSVIALADMAAWERAEGLASVAATEAIRRKDIERFIPGLPARRTFMALGWVTLAAFVIVSALSFLPESDRIDDLETLIQYLTAYIGVAVALWSILSEVRGWEGSDAATWFLKRRVDRYEKQLEPRRIALRDTLVAIGAERLVVYRNEGGTLVREPFAADGILGVSLEARGSHMALRLATRDGARRYDYLPRDAVFEAAVVRFAGLMRTSTVVVPAG